MREEPPGFDPAYHLSTVSFATTTTNSERNRKTLVVQGSFSLWTCSSRLQC